MTAEHFSYGTLGAEQTGVVLRAYEQTRSCKRASLQEGVYVSSATVSRVVQRAVLGGLLDEVVKRGPGRPADSRERASQVIAEFPLARGYTRTEQANLSECSVSTVQRAAQSPKNELV